jgi:ligand-binding sensor domain-containing protein
MQKKSGTILNLNEPAYSLKWIRGSSRHDLLLQANFIPHDRSSFLKLIFFIIAFINCPPDKATSQNISVQEISLPAEIRAINNMLLMGNDLYLATAQGLYKYSNNVFHRYFEQEKADAYRINSIIPDKWGNIWFGTYSGILTQFSKDRIIQQIDLRPYCTNDNYLISSLSINNTDEKNHTEILVSTSGGEIFTVDSIKKTVQRIESPVKGTIYSVQYGIYPATWLCTSDGFFSMGKNKKWKKKTNYFTVYQIVSYNKKYWGIGRDSEKRAMFTLYYDDDGENQAFRWKSFDLSLLSNIYLKFNDLTFADDEIAWIATDSGILSYNPTNAALVLYQKIGNTILNDMKHIAIESNNVLWVATSGRRLIRIEIY